MTKHQLTALTALIQDIRAIESRLAFLYTEVLADKRELQHTTLHDKKQLQLALSETPMADPYRHDGMGEAPTAYESPVAFDQEPTPKAPIPEKLLKLVELNANVIIDLCPSCKSPRGDDGEGNCETCGYPAIK